MCDTTFTGARAPSFFAHAVLDDDADDADDARRLRHGVLKTISDMAPTATVMSRAIDIVKRVPVSCISSFERKKEALCESVVMIAAALEGVTSVAPVAPSRTDAVLKLLSSVRACHAGPVVCVSMSVGHLPISGATVAMRLGWSSAAGSAEEELRRKRYLLAAELDARDAARATGSDLRIGPDIPVALLEEIAMKLSGMQRCGCAACVAASHGIAQGGLGILAGIPEGHCSYVDRLRQQVLELARAGAGSLTAALDIIRDLHVS